MAQKNLVREVIRKNDDGTLEASQIIGASFDDVIDTRANKGNYTLSQFFDNYIDYMNNTTFVSRGTVSPANTHIGVWIDETQTNQDENYLSTL